MRATKQDIGQRAIHTPPIAVRNCRNSGPTGNLPRAVRRGYHNSRSDIHLNGLAWTVADVRVESDLAPIADVRPGMSQKCRVEMWRGGGRLNISVAASFVWRCLSGSALAPFPHPAHRTGRADFPHPALGQDFTPSPTARRAQAGTGVRAGSARKGARVDTLRPCVA